MSSNARSSIDLGVSKPHNSPPTTNFSSSPPRLQHSPSLPNIWFPPHSGPIPQKMSSNHSTKPESRARHIKYASIDPTHRKPTLPKTHARRRTEKDLRHSLLTPPLTPSSSIRTTASHDSSASAVVPQDDEYNDEKMVDTKFEEEIKDVDTQSTRYILAGNLNRSLDVTALTVAVVKSVLIAQGRNPSHSAVPELKNIHQIILAANSKLLESQGIVPIVFYDIRDAKAAMDAIFARRDGPLEAFVADRVDENGERGWLSCKFVDLEELGKILGNSEYLVNTNASFYVAAHNVDHMTPEDDAAQHGGLKGESPTQSTDLSATRGGVNVPMLQKILKSYGNVRSFAFDRFEVLEDKTSAVIYNIEYYNLPDATAALERLQNQTMFGMKINAYRPRSPLSQKQHDASSANVPFPNPSTAGESFNGLASSSLIPEEPFPHPQEDENLLAELGEAVGALSLQPVPSQRVIPSPPFFYHSSPENAHVDLGADVGGPADQQETLPPSTVSQPSRVYLDPQLVHQSTPTEQPWGSDVAYRTQATSPFCSADCTYCPSSRSSNRSGYNTNYAPYSITPPFATNYYYPAAPPTPLPQPIHPHVLFQNTGPSTVYEASDPNAVGFGPWVYDPAIAYAIPNGRNVVPIGNNLCPTPNPYYREDQPGAQYQPNYTTLAPHSRPENGLTAGFVMNSAPLTTIPAPQTPVQQDPAAPSTQTAVAPDRNQLNLAAIRDGRDTRTTVMIKNIPNKMSDTDLMTYIAKVCPRKIDFLYLRMDFQNGCNVGYAFVNFIYVQDLLHFAEKRLGERWNMFSSEKVLQMSYATYQGKEALIEKFKNSCIMDERESWRPKIFYSYGPEQGLSEPFPPSTHRGRKERSSHNRGALFVPSAGGLMHSHRLHNSQGRRQHDTARTQQGRPRYPDQQPPSYYPSR